MLRLIVTLAVFGLPALFLGVAHSAADAKVETMCERYVAADAHAQSVVAEFIPQGGDYCGCMARYLADDPARAAKVAEAYDMLVSLAKQTGMEMTAVRRGVREGTLAVELSPDERKEQADLLATLANVERVVGQNYRTNGRCPA
ncbi:hypothetical protein [Acuticoccus mangrovi]|uniref:Uncharacterized protein n=1 Tax=Acuticoccus mangrovi TaxID=2796142 RepID=A0A934IES2_9HYPH|nr:hypothetical protein [Acuticoccus mangrovi]MBJ3775279.1 hypothetical protein [Acuticoccus mangrovi]